MSDPLVSVIMPAFNEELFIEEAINSILAQTLQNWELLILDDCSSDRTWQIISSFNDPRIKASQNATNQKYQACCNRLFKEAKGEFITFLDADDTCSKERLEACVSALQSTKADFLTTDHRKHFSATDHTVPYAQNIDHYRLANDLDYYPTVCCATVFARREIVGLSGGYSLVFAGFGADDYHWVWRLSRLGKGVHLNGLLYTYRIHGDQMRNEVSPEHFVCHELDRAVRKKLCQEEVDLTLPENEHLADELKAELLRPFKKDPTKILREQAIQELNSGKWLKAISVMRQAVFRSPLVAKNWTRFAYVLYVMARRTLKGKATP